LLSPILVRPVREQLEHDRVIRLLQAKYKRKFEVAINPGNEHTARRDRPAGLVSRPGAAVERAGRKLLGVVEVETAESVNNLEAMSQWATFSRLRAPFHLYHTIPASRASTRRRRRLCAGSAEFRSPKSGRITRNRRGRRCGSRWYETTYLPAVVQGSTPAEQAAFLAEWHSRIRERVPQRTSEPARQEVLFALAERLNPATWTDPESGLQQASEALRRLSSVFAKRRRRSRRQAASVEPGAADQPADS
jgi:hypothetical protein